MLGSIGARAVRRTQLGCVVLALIGTAALVANLFAPTNFPSGRVGQLVLLVEGPLLAVAGAFLVRRRPDHPAGFLLAVAALGLAVDAPAKAVLNLGGTGVAARLAASVENTSWVPTYWAVAMVLILFPDGRLISRRWLALPVGTTAVCGVLLVAGALAPSDVAYGASSSAYAGVRTFVPDTGLHRAFVNLLGDGWPLYLLCVAVAVAGLFVRLGRARRTGDAAATAQLHWLTWSMAAVFAIDTTAGVLAGGWDTAAWRTAVGVVTQAAPCLLVLALVVAITRYGLFEIDRIVSRTVTYVVSTGMLAAVYVGLVTSLSALLPVGASGVVVAFATLAVAALFVPLRRAVQRRVDRRFNRARHDRGRLVAQFAERLRRDDSAALDGAELLAVVQRALEPATAGVWLVPR